MANNVTTFVRELTPLAVEIGDRYGIDPALIITQAAIETGWGSEVAGNNYFGVKSHGRPGGQQVATHEEINGRRVAITDNFRQYGSLAESMEDYAQFLRDNPRYAGVFEAGDLQGQLDAIAASGYATDSNYPTLLRGVSRLVTRNMAPLPPGQIPTVGSELDTARPTYRFDSMGNPINATTGERVLGTDPAYGQLMAFRQAAGNTRPPRVAPTPAPASQRPGFNAQPGAPGARLPAIGPTGGPPLNGYSSRSDPVGSMPSYSALSGISNNAQALGRPQVSASDRARGNSGITTVATIPTRQPVSASDRVRANGGTSAPAPGTRQTVPGVTYAGMDRGPTSSPDRLSSSPQGMPANYGSMTPAQVTQIGTDTGGAPTPSYRTLMQPVRVENPAYTQALRTTTVPAGMPTHMLSRDSVAQAAAGQQMARNLPPRWITQMQQVRVPVAVTPQPRRVAASPTAAPQAPATAPRRYDPTTNTWRSPNAPMTAIERAVANGPAESLSGVSGGTPTPKGFTNPATTSHF